MKCQEIFYNLWEAVNFIEELKEANYDSDFDMKEFFDDESKEKVYIVYYNPKEYYSFK